MTCCTLPDLIDRFGERVIVLLTDRGMPATGIIDQAVVNRALADTDAVINGYLAARYDVAALQPVPALLRDLALSIAIWKLHPAAPDAKIEADYNHAHRTLREIAQGLQKLDAGAPAAEATAPLSIRVTERERPLSAETMRGWI